MNLSAISCMKLFIVHRAKAENVAAELAERCRAVVARQVIGKSKVLPPKQLRGYIRAYATQALESVISGSEALESLDSGRISAIIARAKDLLVELVASEARSMPPKSEVGIAAAA
jgi:hypothetical protein